jgi:hypothetical protein
MGAEYNQFGEDCKSSKKEKKGKFVWVGDQNDTFKFLQRELFLHGVFWPTMEFRVLKLEGSYFGHI